LLLVPQVLLSSTHFLLLQSENTEKYNRNNSKTEKEREKRREGKRREREREKENFIENKDTMRRKTKMEKGRGSQKG
jgi:ATPase subunit of ABC transporter with duplicated ATPase domains